MSDKTCGKCVGGTVVRSLSDGRTYFDVCECRSKGHILVGYLCSSCGGVLDGEQLRRLEPDDNSGGMPSCSPCDGPLECMLVEHEEDRPEGQHQRR